MRFYVTRGARLTQERAMIVVYSLATSGNSAPVLLETPITSVWTAD